MGKLKRIGVLTAGGDCPGLNAVIRALVKTAHYRYGVDVIGFLDGYAGVIRNHSVRLKPADVVGILQRGGTILGTSNRDDPFQYAQVIRGKKIKKDVSDRVLGNLRKEKIDALIVIGGDGSLTIGCRLFEKGAPVIGVPKTIDNDLAATDVTFGFHTAVQTAMEGIDRIRTTAESHHRVMLVEVMGRYAGWIALHSALASGGDVILIPEIPYSLAKICSFLQERHRDGKRFSIIVVAEGAVAINGEMVVRAIVADSTDPVRLGGVAYRLGLEIEKRTFLETRVTVLGHLQRGGSPTAFDRILATRFGVAAVELAWEGKIGRMVSLRGVEIGDVDLREAVSQPKRVSPQDELVRTAKATGVIFGD